VHNEENYPKDFPPGKYYWDVVVLGPATGRPNDYELISQEPSVETAGWFVVVSSPPWPHFHRHWQRHLQLLPTRFL